ncbi:MAG: flavin reductase [Candidatus Sericytochromatia bacterium]|nr:MAG: flavin reductase [Candidatus Sericytochromatia bacterium]
MFKSVNPKDISVLEVQKLLLGGVSPRPIALVSTISENGEPNLSPFSFFNAFGANPPVVAFSASRRIRDASLKDTYNNIVRTKECVIQAVTYDMVEQVSLSSTEYETGINEFVKSGLTPIKSLVVTPPRVKESPFQMECKLLQMINIGNDKGSANIAICEVLYFHYSEDIFKDGIIYPDYIDLVARNSGDFYTRASGNSIFKVEKPIGKKCIGYDNLPEFIKNSNVYTANNLAKLANVEKIPNKDEVNNFIKNFETNNQYDESNFYRFLKRKEHKKMLEVCLCLKNSNKYKYFLELTSKIALENDDIDFAWKVAIFSK